MFTRYGQARDNSIGREKSLTLTAGDIRQMGALPIGMEIPRALGHHDVAEELPLVTDSGTVTLVEAMDHNRVGACRDALRELLAPHGHADWVEEVLTPDNWDRFRKWVRESETLGDRTVANVETLVNRIERPYPSLFRIRVALDEPLSFAPGQYATLRVFDTPRPYSIANSPNDDELEFCIRRVPGGRLTSDLYDRLDAGDEVTIRGPSGEMVLDPPTERGIVFLATGTGVAPYKSMIDYIFEEGRDVIDGQPRDIWLFLGCGWEDDLPYREQFRAYDEEYDHFHFVPTLSRERLLSDWKGERDYVQHVFLKYLAEDALAGEDLPAELEPFGTDDPVRADAARIDPDAIELFACGVTAMVSVLVEVARTVGVPEERMQYEGFG
jgi:ferredoxin-NADP reductase